METEDEEDLIEEDFEAEAVAIAEEEALEEEQEAAEDSEVEEDKDENIN